MAEVSLHIRNGDLRALDWDTAGGQERENLAVAGPGWYRIRGHVRGRDAGWEHRSDPASTDREEHLLIVWREEMSPSRVLVGLDATGRRVVDMGPV